MRNSEQEQLPAKVKMLDGSILDGVRTGNNAAWHCECDQLLVGTTWVFKKPVVCKCGNAYQVLPEEGVQGKSVEYVQQLS